MNPWAAIANPEDLEAQIQAILDAGASREPAVFTPSSASRVVPQKVGTGNRQRGEEGNKERTLNIVNKVEFPSDETMRNVAETVGQFPEIQAQRGSLDSMRAAIQSMIENPPMADYAEPLSNYANYLTKGRFKPFGASPSPQKQLLDYSAKLQDDQRDLAKTIADYIGRFKGGSMRDETLKELTDKFTKETGAPVGSGGGMPKAKLVPETTVAKFSQGQSAIDEVSDLRKVIDVSKDIMGPLAGMTTHSPFTFGTDRVEQQKELNNRFMLLRQTVGKLFEGGVLRKEDEVKYKRIFVDIHTDPAVATANMTELEAMLRRDVSRYMENMGRAGYVTEGFSGQIQNHTGPANQKIVGEKPKGGLTPEKEARRQELLKKAGKL